MKKAIILDVDGVIIGEKKGFNLPHPHIDVMAKLCEVRAKEIPVVLCTAKPAFAIKYEIKEASLNNIHIADGGAILIDNSGKVYEEIKLESVLAKNIVSALLAKNIYTEVYTADNYYIEARQESSLTEGHATILGQKPQIVDSLPKLCEELDITKIAFAVADTNQKPYAEEVLIPFKEKIANVWTHHPSLLPIQWGIVTAPNISKAQATINVSKVLDIPLENMLGVGDSTSDWSFMNLCGYVGAMGNATPELKELAKFKEHIIGDNVDNNGVIDILDWYLKL